MPSAIVFTVSDSCAAGTRTDVSGPEVVARLRALGYEIVATAVLSDDPAPLRQALRQAAGRAQLVVTTGGTGIAARDNTPEATRDVCSKLLDGMAELMRREGAEQTPRAALGRGCCGVCGAALVLNLPGAPGGALAALNAAASLLPHALELLAGNTEHD